MPITVFSFIAKWKKVELTERSASQQHFLDLCELLEHPKPTDVDPTGESFTFEKGVAKASGGDGWADVWKRGHFAWEYKGKHKDLDAAYRQLQNYRDDLENPPLMVVCDMDRIVIRTNFTNTPVQRYTIELDNLKSPNNLQMLRDVFFDPDNLRPGPLREKITQTAAGHAAEIAQSLRDRRKDPRKVARFVDRVIFCLFAEDVGLLPERLFTGILAKCENDVDRLPKLIGPLFETMSTGGWYGQDEIRHFNGDLFNSAEVLDLKSTEINRLLRAAKLDWGSVDPSIFGTLFERGLNPAKRSQIGAHYTSREDIETLIEPVVMQPLRREWEEVRRKADALAATRKPKEMDQAGKLLSDYVARLASVTVLDPACGSGNFLYVTLQKLKDLENDVIEYAASHDIGELTPAVGPQQLYGIEKDPYAHGLAQVSLWIGYLQWMHDHGYPLDEDPVLRCMDNFECKDAIIDLSDPANPKEPEWPEVDYIVGNPPFLGGKRMRSELGDHYVGSLFVFWRDAVRPEADLCCYWFEKARRHVAAGKCKRAGLLATQGIRGGANRTTLERIKTSGGIFFAESDRPWILDGANVHVSMVGFDGGEESARILDGHPVTNITPQLTSGVALHFATELAENKGLSFMGVTPAGPFDIDMETAVQFLADPNPSASSNSDVLRPYLNGKDLNQLLRWQWTVDFGVDMSADSAALYAAPFEYARLHVKPVRDDNRRDAYRVKWWLYAESRPAMRAALSKHSRYLATCMVAKHRLFVWLPAVTVPANVVIVFARSDDYFFGVLHSRLHEVWARAQGTQLRERESGFRYTPTTCFETFPFPEPTPEQEAAIAEAAKELNELREGWLNPAEWTREEVLVFPGSVDGPWARFVHEPDARGIGTVRYPRIVARDPDSAKLLAKRTLTNLYNQRPTWLDNAHRKLDEAVFAAYGWSPNMSDEGILEKLLELNLARAEPDPSPTLPSTSSGCTP